MKMFKVLKHTFLAVLLAGSSLFLSSGEAKAAIDSMPNHAGLSAHFQHTPHMIPENSSNTWETDASHASHTAELLLLIAGE